MRRRAYLVDTSAAAVTITAIALLGPPLLRTGDAPGLLPDALTALISCAAICLVIVGKITLGRSFGIVPANRGIVDKGPYLLVRHPIYAGYLVSHLAFVAAYPTAVEHRGRRHLRCRAGLARAVRGTAAPPGRALPGVLRARRLAPRPGAVLRPEIPDFRFQISDFRTFTMTFLDPLDTLSDPTLVNAQTGAVVATAVEVARTSATRRRGLLGRDRVAGRFGDRHHALQRHPHDRHAVRNRRGVRGQGRVRAQDCVPAPAAADRHRSARVGGHRAGRRRARSRLPACRGPRLPGAAGEKRASSGF